MFRLAARVACVGLAVALSIGAAGAALAAPQHGTGNKGGQERGLDRADQRAGSHGDQGRDRAEANRAKPKPKKPAPATNPGR